MKVSRRTRVVTGGALAAAVALGGFGAWSASASSPAPAVQTAAVAAKGAAKSDAKSAGLVRSTHLSIGAATEAAQAALKAAQKENQRVSVAVVDRDGNTLVTLRGDGAGPQSYESAEKKAYTAVSWNAPTSELVKRLDNAPTLKDIPGTLFLPGGVPVTAKDAPVAGVGVAGAPSGDLDEKFARAGAAALAG
ncbi:heme-binding protein [Streptomyces daliensis]|uniref:Heme-binding protein n=1 Tax=Streptomyces daliensis TaxID=299421 RepID=A0A8T4IXR0_9ACTN|nr:heme-binding protein [Streptomyces daliensis]